MTSKASRSRRAHLASHDGEVCRCLSGKFKLGNIPTNKGMTKETSPSIARMADAHRGKEKSPEHRKALSEAAKRRYSDPAERERTRQQQKERWQDPELRARHSELIKQHWARDPERRFDRGYVNPSKLGWGMIDFLFAAGFEVIIPEVQFGRARVDALLADEWIAFEADESHHQDPVTSKADKVRDEYLMQEYRLPVIRLTEEDLKRLDVSP